MREPRGLEIRCRREALGFTLETFAQWLDWVRSRVSDVEKGNRVWPDWAEKRLAALEEQVEAEADNLADAAADNPVIPTYALDEQLWAERPDLDGMPASAHRAAAIKAKQTLAEEGVTATISNAES